MRDAQRTGEARTALRRIEQSTGVRRETAGAYLREAGIGLRPPGAWGKRAPEGRWLSKNSVMETSRLIPADPWQGFFLLCATSACRRFRVQEMNQPAVR